jgi:hypothetical protein
MSATFSTPPNRLAQRVGTKGVSRSTAIQQAQANLVSMREEGIAYIDVNLDGLNASFADPAAEPAKQAETLYELSDAISSTASLFGFADLGKAAYSLCQLLSAADPEKGFNRAAVKAHLDGMQILRKSTEGADAAASNVILQNLTQLVAYLAPKRDAAPRG